MNYSIANDISNSFCAIYFINLYFSVFVLFVFYSVFFKLLLILCVFSPSLL